MQPKKQRVAGQMKPKFFDDSDVIAVSKLCLDLAGRLTPMPPDKLYHYTTAAGLIGILESKCLRASHIIGMNDSFEFRHSVGSLCQAIEYRQSNYSGISADVKMMLARFRDGLSDAMKLSNVPPIFVSCFTQDVDFTNHWTEYGDRGRGYAVGFAVDGLLKCGQEQGLFLLKCEYDDRSIADIMSKIVIASETIFSEIKRKNPNAESTQLIDDFLDFYTWNLSFLAPAFKSPTFIHESEWRFTRRLPDGDFSSMTFRPKGAEIRPYIAFGMVPNQQAHKLMPITDIYIGPVRLDLDKDISELAVGALLTKYGYANQVTIHRSKSTYRG